MPIGRLKPPQAFAVVRPECTITGTPCPTVTITSPSSYGERSCEPVGPQSISGQPARRSNLAFAVDFGSARSRSGKCSIAHPRIPDISRYFSIFFASPVADLWRPLATSDDFRQPPPTFSRRLCPAAAALRPARAPANSARSPRSSATASSTIAPIDGDWSVRRVRKNAAATTRTIATAALGKPVKRPRPTAKTKMPAPDRESFADRHRTASATAPALNSCAPGISACRNGDRENSNINS